MRKNPFEKWLKKIQTFLHKDQSAFKSAADGVVIYFQNWKKLLKDAAFMPLIVMVVSFLSCLLPLLLCTGLFALLSIHWIFAALLSIMIAAVVKSAFVDSYLMVRMMISVSLKQKYSIRPA